MSFKMCSSASCSLMLGVGDGEAEGAGAHRARKNNLCSGRNEYLSHVGPLAQPARQDTCYVKHAVRICAFSCCGNTHAESIFGRTVAAEVLSTRRQDPQPHYQQQRQHTQPPHAGPYKKRMTMPSTVSRFAEPSHIGQPRLAKLGSLVSRCVCVDACVDHGASAMMWDHRPCCNAEMEGLKTYFDCTSCTSLPFDGKRKTGGSHRTEAVLLEPLWNE